MRKHNRLTVLKRNLKIHREGRNIIVFLSFAIFAINVPVYILTPHWLFAVTLLLSAALLVFTTYFFRNPMRILDVDDPNFLIAPCDGRVVVIEPVTEPDYFKDERLQVSIFMSPFNVHANWYPIEGEVVKSEHQSGRHMGAWLPKSSTENERSLVVVRTASGEEVMIRQVAGAMARRVVTYAKDGIHCHRNEHLGFIKLGSRVDLYLPIDSEIFVDFGDLVKGNETIIGKLRTKDPSEEEPAAMTSEV